MDMFTFWIIYFVFGAIRSLVTIAGEEI
jgi:hypothetical protein